VNGGEDVADRLPAKGTTEMPFEEWYDTLRGLMEKTQEGSGTARHDLARMLESKPDEVRSLNWDKSVRTHLLHAATLDRDPSRHVIPERIAEIKRQLRGDTSSAVEELLIERILTCWTHVFVAEMRWVAKSAQDMPFQAGDYYQRALDRAHRRYVSALKALAEVRKLLGVSVSMVNVVRNQTVSIASANHAAPASNGPHTTAECSRAPLEVSGPGRMGRDSGEGESE
jgi:hypothetical protein